MESAPLLFALNASHAFGERLAGAMGIPLCAHEEREFEDGEHKARPLVPVRDRDVYVLQSLHGRGGQSVNDKLVRLLFFIGAVRDAGAARITAVLPYLCYARKDRRTQPQDPLNSRYTAQLLEAVGTDRVVAVEVHNPAAFENAFRCRAENLEGGPVFVDPVAARVGEDEALVLSPDAGGVKRAERFRELLEQRLGRGIANGFMEKKRRGGVVSGELLVGEIAGKSVVIVDDLVAGGTTLARAAQACHRRGARRIIAVATHPVFAARAGETLAGAPIERLLVADTVPLVGVSLGAMQERVEVIPFAPRLAAAVQHL